MSVMPKPSSTRARILVVDDNVALAENLTEILEGVGYAVQPAATCAEALQRAALGFDVALVDMRLPDGTGTELALQLTERWPVRR